MLEIRRFESMFKTGISFLLLVLLRVLSPAAVSSAQTAEKNEYVNYEVTIVDDQYQVSYRFKDPFGNFQNYTLQLPVDRTDRMISKFGIPRWLFDPYEDNESNRISRQREIAQGMFMLNDQVIEVDKNAVVACYSESFARPIAAMIASSLQDYGRDTRRNRIEFAMRFIQDIPYAIPPFNDKKNHFGGVFVPPKLLIEGYGDCDSKVLLFVSILIHLIPSEDIIFLNQKDHVLSAIRENPEEGLTYVKYKGHEFLIAETAGPGKRLLGQKGNYYRAQFRIEELQGVSPEVLPIVETRGNSIFPDPMAQVDHNILFLLNESDRNLAFQISPDNRRWESLQLYPNQAGKYIFDKKERIFLRIRSEKNKITTYQVDTGNSYTITWSIKRKRWIISA